MLFYKKFKMFHVANSLGHAYNNTMEFAKKISSFLTKKKKTLSVAESCTGGLVANLITDVPGSSKFFKGAVVSYSNEAKNSILHVPLSVIEEHGAVSGPCVRCMAHGVFKKLKTDFSIAVSGIAGPGGGTKEKPVGLTFIALASKNKTQTFKFIFKGSRLSIKRQAAQNALKLFLKFLHEQ